MRKVAQADLISEATKIPTSTRKKNAVVSDQSLQNIFGIEIDDGANLPVVVKTTKSGKSVKPQAKALKKTTSKTKPKLASRVNKTNKKPVSIK